MINKSTINLKAYLQLTRPANIITAIADILLGFAASGSIEKFSLYATEIKEPSNLGWLCLATIGLYGGGVVFNDVFDAELDAIERPERPIPSGKVPIFNAQLLGIGLLTFGIAAAAQVSLLSAGIAGLIAFSAVFYDGIGKHQLFFGPINMGLCRGLNVLLGISAGTFATQHIWLFLIPIIYISAITTISRGEVSGSNHRELKIGLVLYSLVFVLLFYLNFINAGVWYLQLAFVLLLGWVILRPLFLAIADPIPQKIGKAVKMGVIALIILDASLAVAYAGPLYALFMLTLLPISFLLARFFAVT